MEREKIVSAVGKLTPSEFLKLQEAADAPTHGGNPLTGPIREKAHKLGLAYLSGKLKLDVVRYLRDGDEPIIIG
ncbi:MAG: hypothetical protein FJZ43_01840 [Candidatus Staskawiczbacteria bacterium]|nr:hypothetical protein [Candidatus Staskawiczbacteria bacterium]